MARLEDPIGLVCPKPVGSRARSPVGRGLPVLGGGVFVVGRRRRWCQRGQEPRTVLRLVLVSQYLLLTGQSERSE